MNPPNYPQSMVCLILQCFGEIQCIRLKVGSNLKSISLLGWQRLITRIGKVVEADPKTRQPNYGRKLISAVQMNAGLGWVCGTNKGMDAPKSMGRIITLIESFIHWLIQGSFDVKHRRKRLLVGFSDIHATILAVAIQITSLLERMLKTCKTWLSGADLRDIQAYKAHARSSLLKMFSGSESRNAMAQPSMHWLCSTKSAEAQSAGAFMGAIIRMSSNKGLA